MKEKSFAIGDIVLFRDESKEYVAHRVISMSPLTTKGDFSICYESLEESQIFGKALTIRKQRVDISLIGKSLWMKVFSYISSIRIKESRVLRATSLFLLHFLAVIFQTIYSRPKKHRI